MMPATMDATRKRNTSPTGIWNTLRPVAERAGEGPAPEHAEGDSDDGADDGDDHRLPAHHAPDLPTRDADDPQEPELAGALEHRERQCVDDAEDGDDRRQGEQRHQHGEELVDGGKLLVAELRTGQHVDVGKVVAQRVSIERRVASYSPGFADTSTTVSCVVPAPTSTTPPETMIGMDCPKMPMKFSLR